MTELHPCAGCVQPQQFEVVAESCAPIESHVAWYLSRMTSNTESIVAHVEFSNVMIVSGVTAPSAEGMRVLEVVKDGVHAIAGIMSHANDTFNTMYTRAHRDTTVDGAEQCSVEGTCTRVAELFEYRVGLYGLKAQVEEQARAEFSKIHTVQ